MEDEKQTKPPDEEKKTKISWWIIFLIVVAVCVVVVGVVVFVFHKTQTSFLEYITSDKDITDKLNTLLLEIESINDTEVIDEKNYKLVLSIYDKTKQLDNTDKTSEVSKNTDDLYNIYIAIFHFLLNYAKRLEENAFENSFYSMVEIYDKYNEKTDRNKTKLIELRENLKAINDAIKSQIEIEQRKH